MTLQCMNNIIIVLGDLGAGANFVKNTLLLSPDVDFPWHSSADRLKYIISKVYPAHLKTTPSQWIKHEYQLRNCKTFYGADIADDYHSIDTAQIREITQNKKIVFLCHWPHIVQKLKQQYPKITVVSLHAQTQQEVEWQVSQYISKIGIENLQNFSFNDNIEAQKKEFINSHGNKQYYKFNAMNMFEILQQRKDTYANIDYITIRIADLQSNSWIVPVITKLGIELDLEQANKLFVTWQNLCPAPKKYWED